MDFTPIKTSELIRDLQALVAKYGDLPICFDDPDTGWLMPIELRVSLFNDTPTEEIGPLMLITSSYHYAERQ